MVIPLSVLDLVPVPEGTPAGRAFQNSIELAQLADRLESYRLLAEAFAEAPAG